jgi:hypothetical protein
MPKSTKICTGRELAEVLRAVRLTDKEAAAWRRDLRSARKILTPAVRPSVIKPK